MIAANVHLGKTSLIYHGDSVNLCGYEIGHGCTIGAFVRTRTRAKIRRNVRIQNLAPILEGAATVDEAFIDPQVCFPKHKYPRGVNPDGTSWMLMAGRL